MPPLTLKGKPFNIEQAMPLPERVRLFLDKAPANDLLRTEDVAKALNAQVNVLNSTSTTGHDRLAGYSITAFRTRYWGRPKTIAELQRQLEEQPKKVPAQ